MGNATLGSRAILRDRHIDLTLASWCEGCGRILNHSRSPRAVKFAQPLVVCNVYVDGVWDRMEVWHLNCYETAGLPYGPVIDEGRRKGNRR